MNVLGKRKCPFNNDFNRNVKSRINTTKPEGNRVPEINPIMVIQTLEQINKKLSYLCIKMERLDNQIVKIEKKLEYFELMNRQYYEIRDKNSIPNYIS